MADNADLLAWLTATQQQPHPDVATLNRIHPTPTAPAPIPASAATPADAWDVNAPALRDAATAARDPQTWKDAARLYGQALLGGTESPEMHGLPTGWRIDQGWPRHSVTWRQLEDGRYAQTAVETPGEYMVKSQYGQVHGRGDTEAEALKNAKPHLEHYYKGLNQAKPSEFEATKTATAGPAAGRLETLQDVADAVTAGLAQGTRAGKCFLCAANSAEKGAGDYALGTVGGSTPHAVNVAKDDSIFDATYDRWFSPEAYKAATGWQEHMRMPAADLKAFRETHGFLPTPKSLRSLGLSTTSKPPVQVRTTSWPDQKP